MSQNLLLEIGTEEIPAHAMPSILAQLKKLGEDNLRELRLSHKAVKTLGTPRRLALIVEELAAKGEDKIAENRGPSVKIAFDADGKMVMTNLVFPTEPYNNIKVKGGKATIYEVKN